MSVPSPVRESQMLLELDSRNERITFERARLRDIDLKALGIRFVFGFCVSVLVGLIGLAAGDRVAGLFLAFPAILPASLTLIAQKDGKFQAQVDAAGASLGALGLAAYGAVSWYLLPRIPPVIAELCALAAWCVVAIGGYMAVRSRLRA
jgi:uncharacterized membrane protein (GlpM family)